MVCSLVASVLLLSAVVPQEPPVFEFATAWRRVAEALHAECDEAGVGVGSGSGSVMFLRGNEVRGFEAHGFADRDGKRAVDRDTIFHWAS